jgi:hypothetical protein
MGSFSGNVTTLPLITGINSDSAFEVTLPTSGDYQVTWAPDPQPQSGETMYVSLNGTGGVVVCSVPDGQGSLTVPGSFVEQLRPNLDNGAIVFYRTMTIPATSSMPAIMCTTSQFFALVQ